jgi:nicotinamidase/pyrazinamidase
MADKIKIRDSDALIAVDVQNDFIPGGSLAVNEGDRVVPALNMLIPKFRTRVFTRDWHPENHVSFSDDPQFVDKSWPAHCVQGTPGAEFHKDLEVPDDAIIVSKATDPDQDAYSAFEGTGLADTLHERGIKRVMVGGLATDYCVKATALDAIREGFEAVVVLDACRGVDVPPGTAKAAVEEMKAAGAKVIYSGDIE